MTDLSWILENYLLERDNGIWAGEKQFTYSDDENNVYYVNRRRDGSMYVRHVGKRYGRNTSQTTTTYDRHERRRKKKVEDWYFGKE